LLNELKRQQEQDDSKKRSLSSGAKDKKEISDRDKNYSNMPNQYAKFKTAVKGEEEFQADTNHNYGFIDEYLEEAINISNDYESIQEIDYNY
jgi:hypothetical protein